MLELYTLLVGETAKARQNRNILTAIGVIGVAFGAYVHQIPYGGFMCLACATFTHLVVIPNLDTEIEDLKGVLSKKLGAD